MEVKPSHDWNIEVNFTQSGFDQLMVVVCYHLDHSRSKAYELNLYSYTRFSLLWCREVDCLCSCFHHLEFQAFVVVFDNCPCLVILNSFFQEFWNTYLRFSPRKEFLSKKEQDPFFSKMHADNQILLSSRMESHSDNQGTLTNLLAPPY